MLFKLLSCEFSVWLSYAMTINKSITPKYENMGTHSFHSYVNHWTTQYWISLARKLCCLFDSRLLLEIEILKLTAFIGYNRVLFSLPEKEAVKFGRKKNSVLQKWQVKSLTIDSRNEEKSIFLCLKTLRANKSLRIMINDKVVNAACDNNKETSSRLSYISAYTVSLSSDFVDFLHVFNLRNIDKDVFTLATNIGSVWMYCWELEILFPHSRLPWAI